MRHGVADPPGDRPRPQLPILRPRSVSIAALAMLVLAVAVQVLVWGRAPAHSSSGALLPGLRSVFGTVYAAVLIALELVLCLLARRRGAATAVLVAAAAVDAVFWVAYAAGARFAIPGAASMTAAFGAVGMAAGLWWRRQRSR
jgi:hypothetical protein